MHADRQQQRDPNRDRRRVADGYKFSKEVRTEVDGEQTMQTSAYRSGRQECIVRLAREDGCSGDVMNASTAKKWPTAILNGLGFNKRMQEKKTRDFYGRWRTRIYRRKTSSRRVVKKKATISVDDNIVPKPDIALELGKSISLTKAEEEAAARQVHAAHASLVRYAFYDA
ncbi:hypothetical protein Tco_0785811 [Tanacetum coccineum]